MGRRVVAIGLDGASLELVERWMDAGALPALAALRAQGAWGRLRNIEFHRTEAPWITFLTGCLPTRTGEWGHSDYHPDRYEVVESAAYRFDHPPFYGLGNGLRLALFDVPMIGPRDGLDGIQLLGWGTEANQCLRTSLPAGLMGEILARHGPHPLLDDHQGNPFRGPSRERADGAAEVRTVRLPSVYDGDALRRLEAMLLTATARRAAIIDDLWGRGPWDLFMPVFAEVHSAGHLLWHLSQPHPLREAMAAAAPGADPLLAVYRAVDRAIGAFADRLPPEVDLVVYAIHGMIVSSMDICSTVALPELLYRWSFPGKAALAPGGAGMPPPPPRLDYRRHWKDEVWRLATADGRAELESPEAQGRRADPLDWQPTNWYRPLWPAMKAFAIPTYAEGIVRVNVAGREARGCIAPEAFDAVCDELRSMLLRLRDPRSGKAVVREVLRVRPGPFDQGILGLPGDLMVLWQDERAVDVVDSPELGRVGPVPFFRTGAHHPSGFIVARGPGIAAGTRLPDSGVPDLSATLLELLGRPRPDHLEGRPFLRAA
jgi:predicted AlkP superfamily phosphohydrolase/phosphomutase